MSTGIEIQLIAIVVAMASTILGVFLVLKGMAMITDAITHTILLGIILAYLIVRDINSPFLILGAGLIGVATVYLVELLNKTGLVREDSAIGIVYSFLFSVAVILISKYTANIHLDVDAVLLGEIAFAPFDRTEIFGVSMASSLVNMSFVLLINIIFVVVFYKELKISTFDKGLAMVLGLMPNLVHYILIGLVSITSVASFQAVGSILVVAFAIGPAVSAYLLVKDLKFMIILALIIGAISSVIGYHVALFFDVSISGSISVVIGLIFFLCLIYTNLKLHISKKTIAK